jgi:propanol-preferring alcohol dehydrogenase
LEFLFRDIHVSGSFMASQKETEEMLHAVVDHNIHLENNVFHGLKEIPRAVDMLKNVQYRGKACFIIDPDAEGVERGNGKI